MNSLEDKFKIMTDSVKNILERVLKVSERKDPPKPELPADFFQRPLQPVLEVKDEVSRMSHQLSKVALTQAISATMSLLSATKAAATTTVLMRTFIKPESETWSADCTSVI
jgi:hypothetical protein